MANVSESDSRQGVERISPTLESSNLLPHTLTVSPPPPLITLPIRDFATIGLKIDLTSPITPLPLSPTLPSSSSSHLASPIDDTGIGNMLHISADTLSSRSSTNAGCISSDVAHSITIVSKDAPLLENTAHIVAPSSGSTLPITPIAVKTAQNPPASARHTSTMDLCCSID